nr:hypothetical protein [Tanacetum cinerariifolium]
MISLTVSSPIASPATAEAAGFLTELEPRDIGELFTRSRAVRGLDHEQERTAMTFGALWWPVLALEAWAGHVDTRMIDMSQAG